MIVSESNPTREIAERRDLQRNGDLSGLASPVVWVTSERYLSLREVRERVVAVTRRAVESRERAHDSSSQEESISQERIDGYVRAKIIPVMPGPLRLGREYTLQEREVACNLLSLVRGISITKDRILNLFNRVFSAERSEALFTEVIENL